MEGKPVAEKLYQAIRSEVMDLKRHGIVPCLAVILVGDNPASVSYVTAKERTCEELGMRSVDLRLAPHVTTEELITKIQELNADASVHGILVQLPLPEHIDSRKVLLAIDAAKDVDGFLPYSAGLLMTGQPGFVPCTPAGVMEMLDYYQIPLQGKHAVVVGRSLTVGKPLALLLLDRHCTLSVCHSRTPDLGTITRQADILVAAVGRPQLIRGDMVKEGAVVIDVGVNRIDDPTKPRGFRLVGDTVHAELLGKVSYLTPVPGGVGPMTIAMLMKNTLTAALKSHSTG